MIEGYLIIGVIVIVFAGIIAEHIIIMENPKRIKKFLITGMVWFGVTAIGALIFHNEPIWKVAAFTIIVIIGSSAHDAINKVFKHSDSDAP